MERALLPFSGPEIRCVIGRIGLLKLRCGIIQNLGNHVIGVTRRGDEGGGAAVGAATPRLRRRVAYRQHFLKKN
jgi:hypothetical protein